MAATADMILELRRKINELTSGTYSDSQLAAFIEKYPLVDVNGQQYYVYPQYRAAGETVVMLNPNWIPTYFLNSAAADIWEEKAVPLSDQFDFSADGASYSRSQPYEHALQLSRYFRGRRAAGSTRVTVWPPLDRAWNGLDRDDSNVGTG